MNTGINIFLGFWLLFMVGFEGSRHNLFKLLLSGWRLNAFVSYVGLWHSWSMFAPSPLHSNRCIFAKVVDPTGAELAVWTEPDWTVMCMGKKPLEGQSKKMDCWAWARGKWDLFRHMRLRKIFSSCGEGRQWDMPLLLRQMCRECERHMIRQGIYGHSIALFIDIDYAPYFCPKDGIKDWKCNKDQFDHLVYVYECEKTTIANATHSKDRDALVVHIPYSVRWEWERRNPINQGQEYWDYSYVDESGQKWEPTVDTPKKRNMDDAYELRTLDNEFLEETEKIKKETKEIKETEEIQVPDDSDLEEYVVEEHEPHFTEKDPSNGGSI